MKVLFVTLVVLGIGLGPGLWAARRRRRAEDGGRLWLGQIVVAVVSLAWVAAILLIMKEVL